MLRRRLNFLFRLSNFFLKAIDAQKLRTFNVTLNRKTFVNFTLFFHLRSNYNYGPLFDSIKFKSPLNEEMGFQQNSLNAGVANGVRNDLQHVGIFR